MKKLMISTFYLLLISGCSAKFDLSSYGNEQITKAREGCALGTTLVLSRLGEQGLWNSICKDKGRKTQCKLTPEEQQEYVLSIFNGCVEGVLKQETPVPDPDPSKGELGA